MDYEDDDGDVDDINVNDGNVDDKDGDVGEGDVGTIAIRMMMRKWKRTKMMIWTMKMVM